MHLNRETLSTKHGLEVSEHRDKAAFRTRKSRALNKLSHSVEWGSYNRMEQAEKVKQLVEQLEAEHEAKRREHELEWIRKTEMNEISEDEEELGYSLGEETAGNLNDRVVIKEDSGIDEVESWYGFSDKEDKDVPKRPMQSLGAEALDIIGKSGKEYFEKLSMLEEKAEESADRLEAYLRKKELKG